MKNRSLRKYKFLSLLMVSLLLVATAACAPSFPRKQGSDLPLVILEFSEFANRPEILIQDLELDTAISPPGDLKFTPNASAAVWIGKDFPYEKAIQVILISKRYYTELRYLALSDYRLDPPDSAHKEIYVGGATDTALRLRLKAWTLDDFQNLRAVHSREEYIALIESHYPKEDQKNQND